MSNPTQEEAKKAQELRALMDQQSGTEQYHRHFSGYIFTDGIKALADKAGAYWLLDAIFSYRRKENFQLWRLTVTDKTATLTMKEDTSEPIKVSQFIPFTDFPPGIWEFYLVFGNAGWLNNGLPPNAVLMLKSEY